MIIDKSNIFYLLNISDPDDSLNIDYIREESPNKIIGISRKLSVTFCPVCNTRMYSKGNYIRTVNHPITQDGWHIILEVSQRKWHCTKCNSYINEQFTFLQKYKQYSNVTVPLILEAMKNLNNSAAEVGRRFNMSDSEIHDIFSMYVDMKRLGLPEYISIDEVFLDISNNSKYAFIIMDFVTGQIVDIVHNRWKSTLTDYFYSIPLSERKNVKGVISDAYGYYQEMCTSFFPNGCHILDSFHVVKFIIQRLNNYVNDVMKKYKQNQKEELKVKNSEFDLNTVHIRDSIEVILLRDYRWVLLKNSDEISYSYQAYYHSKLGMYVDTKQIEDMFFKLDDNFIQLRDLKEKYIEFNSKSYKNDDECRRCLLDIINLYKNCKYRMFNEFACFLNDNLDSIIRSFTTVEVSRKSKKDQDMYYSRLSNGPMEGFNRKPKDLKRNSRGFSNFDYTRNRILFSTRDNPSFLAVPKALNEIHSYKKK